MESLKETRSTALFSVIWTLVFVSLLMVAMQARKTAAVYAEAQKAMESAGSLSALEVKKTSLNIHDYKKVREKLSAVYKDVRFEDYQDGSGIQIRVTSVADYDRFKEVMADLINSVKGARWDAVKICAGKGCGGAAFSVSLKGYYISVARTGF